MSAVLENTCPHNYSIGFVLQGGCPRCALAIQRPERVLTLLRDIEFGDNRAHNPSCPKCGGQRGDRYVHDTFGESEDHRPDCELAAIIAELERPS